MFHRQLCINNHVKSSFLKNIGHTDAKTIRIEVVSVYLLRFLLYLLRYTGNIYPKSDRITLEIAVLNLYDLQKVSS